jgi:hypothetical protein
VQRIARRLGLTGAAFLALLPNSALSQPAEAPISVERAFDEPVERAAPGTYWYWMSDDISAEGITKDLEAMKRAGIAEALIGNIDENRDHRGPVKALSPQWWSMVRFAMEEGARIGVDVGLFNSPGWSQSGGPWIAPGDSMRYITSTTLPVVGGKTISVRLPEPAPDFQDIALLAYPLPALDGQQLPLAPRQIAVSTGQDLSVLFDGDLTTIAELPSAAGSSVTIDIVLPEAKTLRAMEVFPGDEKFYGVAELQLRQADASFRTIASGQIDRRETRGQLGPMNSAPMTFAFPAAKGAQWRVKLSSQADLGSFKLAEIKLTGAARLDRYIEKQLGKLWQTPEPLWDAYLWPQPPTYADAELLIDPDDIIDLTGKLGPNGTLSWRPPPGRWLVSRFGMAPTGVQNGPASPEATGLEVDKLNRDAVGRHFDDFVGQAIAQLGPEGRRAFKTVVADSYEQGSNNWTEGFAEKFIDRFGYDPTPWLPVTTGRIIGSSDRSERFLWDLRRLVADLIATEYVGGLRDKANAHGLKLWIENYGHWGFPGESLKYGGQADEIGAEFWVNPEHRGEIEIRAATSTAHVYGKDRVSAEAYTNEQIDDHWSLAPWSLKRLGDRATAEGINHFVLHVYIHQPRDAFPGVNAWFGSEFNRGNTWFGEAKAWTDYLRRSHSLLQQGRTIADLAYFLGSDAPKMIGTRDPALPAGYDFDYINEEAIETMLTMEEGRFTLAHGVDYAMMVLPPQDSMTPQVLARLEQLVAQGGALYGPRPVRSPSLQSYPTADGRVAEMAARMWGDCDGKTVTSVTYGAGRIFCGGALPDALARIGVAPDVTGYEARKVVWHHRNTEDADIYFLANQTDTPVTFAPQFRDAREVAEYWDPVSKRKLSLTHVNGRIEQLTLAPFQSAFIVFRDKPTAKLKSYAAFQRRTPPQAITGSWQVAFDPAWGGPSSVTFNALSDWSTHSDPGIRYYSGTATYTRKLRIDELPGDRPLLLDLGTVRDMAIIHLNGKRVGEVWTAPWEIDISDHARRGDNTLRIDVINGWANRIIGDLRHPDQPRLTTTVIDQVSAETPLAPAGLLGPVTLSTLRPRR